MDDQEEQLADQQETANEIAGLRAAVVELRRLAAALRQTGISLREENELLRGQLAQQQAVADDTAGLTVASARMVPGEPVVAVGKADGLG
jgi:hypothetical protein